MPKIVSGIIGWVTRSIGESLLPHSMFKSLRNRDEARKERPSLSPRPLIPSPSIPYSLIHKIGCDKGDGDEFFPPLPFTPILFI